MITTEGRVHIKRYLAGMFTDIGRSIAVGVGSTPATLDDQHLQFEVYRVPVDILSYDFENDRLVFKSSLPNDFAASIREFGLYSKESSFAGAAGGRSLVTFESLSEIWYKSTGEPAVFTIDGPVVGQDALLVTTPSGQNNTVTLQNIAINLTDYSAADRFAFAFQSSTGNVSSIQFKFMTDASNFYYFTVQGAQVSNGLNIVYRDKGAAVVSGAPEWSSITSVSVIVTSTAAGTSTVKLEGVRIDDIDTVDEGYVLVSRVVLPEAYLKVSGSTQDIEFPLGVTLG